MTKVEGSAAIDLSTWSIPSLDEWDDDAAFASAFRSFALRIATEALSIAIKRGEIWLDLPFVWAPKSDGSSGPAPTDPLALYLIIGLGPDEGSDEPAWNCTLEQLIDQVIETLESSPGAVTSGNGHYVLRCMANRMRDLAAKLEEAIK